MSKDTTNYVQSFETWENGPDGLVTKNDLVLSKTKHIDFYPKDEESVEQLSPKGLALLSSCYADKHPNQMMPFIAVTPEALQQATRALERCPVGTELGVIYTNEKKSYHKISLKILKNLDGSISVFYMDSVENFQYFMDAFKQIELGLTTASRKNLKFYSPNFARKENSRENYSRQYDTYQCGTFSFKDTRELLSQDIKTNDDMEMGMGTYQMPPAFMKGVQSQNARNKYLADLPSDQNSSIVSKKKKETLQEFYNRYQGLKDKASKKTWSYTNKFSQKYLTVVTEALENNPNEIRDRVNHYDAASLTSERILIENSRKKIDDLNELQRAVDACKNLDELLSVVEKYVIRIENGKLYPNNISEEMKGIFKSISDSSPSGVWLYIIRLLPVYAGIREKFIEILPEEKKIALYQLLEKKDEKKPDASSGSSSNLIKEAVTKKTEIKEPFIVAIHQTTPRAQEKTTDLGKENTVQYSSQKKYTPGYVLTKQEKPNQELVSILNEHKETIGLGTKDQRLMENNGSIQLETKSGNFLDLTMKNEMGDLEVKANNPKNDILSDILPIAIRTVIYACSKSTAKETHYNLEVSADAQIYIKNRQGFWNETLKDISDKMMQHITFNGKPLFELVNENKPGYLRHA